MPHLWFPALLLVAVAVLGISLKTEYSGGKKLTSGIPADDGVDSSARLHRIFEAIKVASISRSKLLEPGMNIISVNNHGGSKCNVKEFGAIGDGLVFDTSSIQAAIEFCAQSGGGTVTFPKGHYLTATLFLRSHITLALEEGAVIVASPNLKDYPPERERWYTVLAENVTDVALTGPGVIYGQAPEFVVEWNDRKNGMVSWNHTGQCSGDECRPRLVGFLDSRKVEVRSMHMHDPAYWCLHLVRCDDVHISHLTIWGNFTTPNNDGIDVDGTRNALVEAVRIDTGDDAICPKSTAGPVVNLTVRDSWLRSKSSAIKLGSGTEHGFHNLTFERIEVVDCHRGLAIQLRDQGSIEDVTFRNIVISTRFYDPSWWGRAEPLYVTACARNGSGKVGHISNITFTNISSLSENGAFFAGSSSSPLAKISLTNVSLELARWTPYQGGLQDFRPGCQGLVPHPPAGIFLMHVKDINLQDVSLTWGRKFKNATWGMALEAVPETIGEMSMAHFQFFGS